MLFSICRTNIWFSVLGRLIPRMDLRISSFAKCASKWFKTQKNVPSVKLLFVEHAFNNGLKVMETQPPGVRKMVASLHALWDVKMSTFGMCTGLHSWNSSRLVFSVLKWIALVFLSMIKSWYIRSTANIERLIASADNSSCWAKLNSMPRYARMYNLNARNVSFSTDLEIGNRTIAYRLIEQW